MPTQRIEYIDWLKGLSIICVVWFHLPHPHWLELSFRMPLFFMMSGVFFKIVSFPEHVRKKTRQLIIPFFGFYVIYYIYMLFEYAVSPTHPEHVIPYSAFFDLFDTHRGWLAIRVNSPLWFILSLLNLQLITMLLMKLLRKRILVLIAGLAITVFGTIYILPMDTYFMFGRSMPFLIYYVVGHLYGRQLLGYIERGHKQRMKVAACTIVLMGGSLWKILSATGPEYDIYEYIFNFGLIPALMLLFRRVSRVSRLRFFHFFGRNSYVVLGTHYIFVQMIYMVYAHYDAAFVPEHGVFFLVLILLIESRLIKWVNRYLPELAGKKRERRSREPQAVPEPVVVKSSNEA